MTGNVDYANTYFKYKNPTPINDEPTHKALKRLKNELRANASSVDTDLGGGDHGYLGLVLTDPEYANINPAPPAFIAPVFPGPLTIPATATAVQAVQARETHNEQIRVYRECKNVEKALLRHLQSAIENRYIEHLVNEDTGLIDDDIPTVLEYLFTNYGKVSSEEVKEKEAEVLNISFNPADPMVTIYRPIEQLQKLAISAKIPYSSAQLLELGLTSIKKTRDFEKALGEWSNKNAIDKTWSNFKTHFKKAQTDLKDIRGPTMQQSGFHHANMLADHLRNDITTQNEQLMAMMQNMQIQQIEPEPPQQVANATVTDDVNIQILRLLQTMNEQMNTTNGNNNGETNRRNNGSRNRTRRTPDNAAFERADTSHYCWTHGGCNHESAQCRRKAQGHKDEATFANKMGGSCAFCPP